MKNNSGYTLLIITIGLGLAWTWWGVNLFFDSQTLDYKWARGELGDFLGGGLGGIAIIIIIYTAWVQQKQIKQQQDEVFEAGVFRTFQALKPEVEGLSARIVSKVVKAGLVGDDEEQFEDMLKKFKSNDRTIFLRAMQKNKYRLAINSDHADQEVQIACDRFTKILKLMNESLKTIAPNSEDDFTKAIRSTEIFITYKKVFLTSNY